MVTSVNSSLLAALQAKEHALANRQNGVQQPVATDGGTTTVANPAVVYSGSSGTPDLSAVLSVQDSLNRAAGIADVGINAGQTISGLLAQAREKITAAQAGGGDADTSALNDDYQKLLQTIDQLARSASFQSVTMLDGSATGDLTFKADVTGQASLSLTPQDFTVGGPMIGLAGTDLTGSSGDLTDLLSQVNAAGAALSGQLSQMNGEATQIQTHLGAVTQLSSALAGGSPDLDADGARLMALQIQQALAGQPTAIGNQAPQAVLALFRNA
jgi:flagellin